MLLLLLLPDFWVSSQCHFQQSDRGRRKFVLSPLPSAQVTRWGKGTTYPGESCQYSVRCTLRDPYCFQRWKSFSRLQSQESAHHEVCCSEGRGGGQGSAHQHRSFGADAHTCRSSTFKLAAFSFRFVALVKCLHVSVSLFLVYKMGLTVLFMILNHCTDV